MAPKKPSIKKGKKAAVSDDEYDVEPSPVTASVDEEPAMDTADFNKDEEGNDLGGLMSIMAKAKGTKKGTKARKREVMDDGRRDRRDKR
jgi:hypothetical protein